MANYDAKHLVIYPARHPQDIKLHKRLKPPRPKRARRSRTASVDRVSDLPENCQSPLSIDMNLEIPTAVMTATQRTNNTAITGLVDSQTADAPGSQVVDLTTPFASDMNGHFPGDYWFSDNEELDNGAVVATNGDLIVDAYIDFGNEYDDDVDNGDDERTQSSQSSSFSVDVPSGAPNTASASSPRSPSQNLLEHFGNPGVVGAFRRQQTGHHNMLGSADQEPFDAPTGLKKRKLGDSPGMGPALSAPSPVARKKLMLDTHL